MKFKGKANMILNPNCSSLVLRLKDFTLKQILEELKKIGIIEVDIQGKRLQLADKDNPNIPDFTYHAIFEIMEDLEYPGPYIEAGQHTQSQIFPTILKIIEHFKHNFLDFKEEWIQHDGGWLGLYEEWIEKGKPKFKDIQTKEGKLLRKINCHFD